MNKKDNYINYKGKRYDLTEWVPMSTKADEMGRSEGYIRKLVFRTRHELGGKTIEYITIPELKLTLVKK